MRDQYAGDISDYIKFSFLQAVVPKDAVLGVAWYYVQGHDGRQDGRHIEYCSEDKWQTLNEHLHTKLCGLAVRSIQALEQLPIWNSATVFHRTPLNGLHDRKNWADEMCSNLSKSDFIFIDPDNGISLKDQVEEKHASLKEISALTKGGRSLVFIRFPHQNTKHLVQLDDLHAALKEFRPVTLRTCVRVSIENGKKVPRIRWFTILNGDDEAIARVRMFSKKLSSIEDVTTDLEI
jgi:hypothetical protein